MNILDKLWSGKILPCEQFVRGSEEYFDALHSAADAKEQLLAARLIIAALQDD